MADSKIILEIAYGDTLKKLEDELKNASKELKNAKFNTEEFNKATEKFNGIKTAISKVTSELKQTGVETDKNAKYQRALAIAQGEVNASLGEMQKAYRLLKNESFGDKSEKEIAKLNTAVGKLKNDIMDTSAFLKATDKGEIFTNMAQGLRGAVAGAQLLGATFKLLGVESDAAKKLEQATLQLVSATQALSVIMELKEKKVVQALAIQVKQMVQNAAQTALIWSQTVALTANTRAEEAKAIMTSRAGLASKAAAAMQWLWNAAILASPIGWIALAVAGLAVGIGALIIKMNQQTEAERLNVLQKKANLEIQNEVNNKTGEAVAKLKALQAVVNDTNLSEEKRTDALKLLNKELGGNIDVTDLSKGALLNLNAAIDAHIAKLQKQAEAQAWLQKYQEGYKKLIDYQTDLTKSSGGFIEGFMKFGDNVAKTVGFVEKDFDRVKTLREGNQIDNIKKQEELNKIYLEGIKKTVDYTDLAGKQEKDIVSKNSKNIYDERTKWSKLFEKERDEEIKKVIKRGDELTKIEEKKMLDAKKRLDEQFKLEEEQTKKLIELDRLREENKVKNENEALERINKYNEQNLEIERAYNNAVLDVVKMTFDTVFAIKAANDEAYYNSKLQKINDDSEAEKEKLKEQLDSKLISQEQYENKIKVLDAARKAQESKVKMDAFKKAQKAAVIQATINGALALVSALASVPLIPTGVVAAALAVAGTIASIATIKSQPVPQFAGGGKFKTTKPTMIMVGDNPGGVEELSIKPVSGTGATSVTSNSGLIRMSESESSIADGGYGSRTSTTDYTGLKEAVIQGMQEAQPPVVSWKQYTDFNDKQTRINQRGQL